MSSPHRDSLDSRHRGFSPTSAARRRRARKARLEPLEHRVLLASLQFAAGLGEQSTLDTVAESANYLTDVNSAATQKFTHSDGIAVSNVTLTTAASTTNNPGVNLDILAQENVDKNGIASVAVNAGASDTSGNIGAAVPVTIVATNPDEQDGDPVNVEFAFSFNVKSFAANNATATLTYSASYTYNGVTTPLASKTDQLGGSGVTPLGPGPVDVETGTLHADIGDTFTLTFSENLAGHTIAPYVGAGLNNVSWLVDANLDVSLHPTMITPVPPTWDSTDGGIDYGYTISGAALPQATTVDLDWAGGSTVDTVIGNPIVSTTTETAEGTYDLDATPAQLATPPPGATDLLVVADPQNVITPADPTKEALLPLPGIEVTSFGWHPDTESTWASDPVHAGGVDFDYTISGSDLPKAVPVYLYWADGATVGDTLGSPVTENDDGTPIMTDTAQGSYQIHVSAARLGTPPNGSTNLLVVVDPPDDQNSFVPIADPYGNANVACLGASAPDILANSIHLTINGPTIQAEFMPAEGSDPPAQDQPAMGALTLSQAEAIVGADHFNWIQYLQMPSYEHEYRYYGAPQQELIDQPVVDPDDQVTNTVDVWLESDLAASATNLSPLAVDAWPFYLDEPSQVLQFEYPQGAQDPSALEFEDAPEQPDNYLAKSDSWSYTTQLVAVSAGPVYSEVPLALTPFFTWKDNAVYDHLSSSGAVVSGGVVEGSPGSTTAPPIVSGGVFDAQAIDEQPTSMSDVSATGTFGRTSTLTSTLTSGGSPVANKTVSFSLNEGGTMTTVGTATTNASGVATLSGVNLVGFSVGSFAGIVGASFAGDSADSASRATGNLNVEPQSTSALTLAPIPNQTVLLLPGIPEVGPQSTTLTVTASATDTVPGAIVSYSIAPGGPVGPTIGPASGVFSWTVWSSQGVPGIYPVTIDAIDDSVPTQSATTSFTIDIQQQTIVTAVSGSGTAGGTGALTATLQSTTSIGSTVPLAGETIAFSVNHDGTVTPLGTATTNPSGIASLGGVNLTSFSAGTFPGAIQATFAGNTTEAPSGASGSLSISQTSGSPLVLAPVSDQTVVQGAKVSVTASATDLNPGAVLLYSLAAGAPAGASIAPTTGIFSWSVPASQAPGDYPVTIDVIDNSSPPQTDETSFKIVVQQATTLTSVSGSGTLGGAITLTATLVTSAGSPVTGETVAFTLSDGGAATPIGVATTDAEGVASLTVAMPTGLTAGAYEGAVGATFAGDSTDASTSSSGNLAINQPSGTTYTVSSLGDTGTGSGDSGDLRYAIAQANANPGSTIDFAVIGVIQLTKVLPAISADVTINGPSGGSLTIDGLPPGSSNRYPFSVFTVDASATASISGLSIAGNYAPRVGTLDNSGNLTLTECTISDNTGESGPGGVFNAGTMTLIDSTVSGNSTPDGAGGIANKGTMTLIDSIVSGNSAAGYGGGIDNTGALTLTDSTILGNTAKGGNGGGIYNSGGTLLVAGSAISGNSSRSGGGLFNAGKSSLVTLSSSSLSGNTAIYGGAISNWDTLTLTGCTLSKNAATFGGGAILNESGGGNGGAEIAEMTLTDSTVSDNSAADVQSGPTSLGGSGGGAILNFAGVMTLTDSTLSGNSAPGSNGGGIQNYGAADMTLIGSTISGNSTGGSGGGIGSTGFYYNGITKYAYLTVIGSTIYGNTASNGGGVDDYLGHLVVANCTITANYASALTSTPGQAGGGLKVESPPSAMLENTLIAGNLCGGSTSPSPGDVSGPVDPRSSYNLIGDGDPLTGIANGHQGNLIGSAKMGNVIDAELGPLANNGGPTATVALLPGSPAIGAGEGGASIGSSGSQSTAPTPPAVTAVRPAAGPTTGGTLVTITGTGFTGATVVDFGTVEATGVTVVNSTTITSDDPAGTGVVDVTVTTPAGTSAISAADQFAYVVAPAVTGLSPPSGPGAGGTLVTITGTGFTGATVVDFGTAKATGVTMVNGTTITADDPAGTGVVDVTVTTPGGTSATSAADRFAYFVAPAVTGLSPTSGPGAGGTLVTITGANLASATVVDFGPTPVTNFLTDTAAEITLLSPAGSGTVNVTVQTAGGESAISLADRYNYLPSQTVPTNLSAVSGSGIAGGAATLTSTLTANAVPLPGKTVIFTLNEDGTVRSVGNATTDANGVATLTGVSLAGLNFGTYSGAVGASFAGDATYAGSSADGTLTIAASSYLEVTRNPTNQVASAGSRVSFVAGAAGSPSPTVQWQVSTDGGHTFGNIPGATSATLTFNPTAGQSGDEFRAVFTNSSGTGTTAPATLTVNHPKPLLIIGEQALFRRRTNSKGKPVGGPVLSGFTFLFSAPLNPSSATRVTNYQVDTVTTKRVKKNTQRVLHPITSFSVAYSAASDSVTLTFVGKQTFPTGGQVTVASGPRTGITAVSGAALAGNTVFTISQGGHNINAQ
ncbi:MAG: IPT/TIG domain-containing protein [Isosphaeraceae bacterium]